MVLFHEFLIHGMVDKKVRRTIAALLLVIILFSAASAPAEDFLLGVVPEPSSMQECFRQPLDEQSPVSH